MKKTVACYCCAVCINLVLLTCNLAAQTANANERVRFRLVRDHLIVVPVQVNGAGKFDFLLDTGTNTTLITPALATQLNIRPIDRLEVVTVNGSSIAPRAWLPHLALGSRSTENAETVITDLPELRSLDRRICGVLGQNFLAHFNYLLDYRERLIVFADADENRWRGTRLPVEQNEGKLLLTAQSTKSNRTGLKLVLDSATPGLVLFEAGYRKLENEIERSEESFVQVGTIAGSSLARSGVLRRVWFGNESFNRLPVTLLQSQAATHDRTEDGLLPTCLFRVIFFNNKEGYVIFNPRKPE